jgi:hypothetical protein
MNINLDTQFLKNYKHGKLVYSLYSFEEKWFPVGSLIQPMKLDKSELKKAKDDIKENRRVDPIISLEGFGIVSGFHLLGAYKELSFERVPVIYGKLK